MHNNVWFGPSYVGKSSTFQNLWYDTKYAQMSFSPYTLIAQMYVANRTIWTLASITVVVMFTCCFILWRCYLMCGDAWLKGIKGNMWCMLNWQILDPYDHALAVWQQTICHMNTVRNTLREIELQNDYCNGCGLTDHGCGMTLLSNELQIRTIGSIPGITGHNWLYHVWHHHNNV